MSIGLVAKLALVTTMAIASIWGDIIVPVDSGPCSDPGSYNCCVHQCIHDSSTGCNGGTRCCQNVCA